LNKITTFIKELTISKSKIETNKCYIKIYSKTRHESIDNTSTLETSTLATSDLVTTELNNSEIIEIEFNMNDTINLFKQCIAKNKNISPFLIHIYFDEFFIDKNINLSPYRLSNGLVLWDITTSQKQQVNLLNIGFGSKKSKGWSSSLPNDIKLEYLYKKNIFNYVAIIEI